MKVLEIGGKNYTVEYSIEASLYSDCTVKLMDLMGAMETKDPKEAIKKMAYIYNKNVKYFEHIKDQDTSLFYFILVFANVIKIIQ